MWRVLKEKATFLQGFHDQPNVALFQIPHAAMCQLGAAAGRAFAEVALLQQQHVVPARRSIDSHPDTSGSAAYDNHVPGFGVRLDATPHVSAIHSPSLYCETSGRELITGFPLP